MSAPKDKKSQSSILEATRGRADFSGHGSSLGAAGYRDSANDPENCEFLNEPGQNIAINTGSNGFESMLIGVAWDNIEIQDQTLLGKLLKKKKMANVDLDIGCLYELQNGKRGAVQAFGEKFGHFDKAPFIQLSGDERTGDADGHDEYMLVNGAHWNEIKRILVYIYIYDGAPKWSDIKPQIILDVPGEDDLIVTLGAHNDALSICAVGGLENVRGNIKLINYTEYFPGHEEMDRAFGFGLEWGEGEKAQN